MTITSGWLLNEYTILFFGDNTTTTNAGQDRSALIWGMQFDLKQFTGVKIKIKFAYFKDSGHSDVYAQPRIPFNIQPSDLDKAGVYWFKDANDPTKFSARLTSAIQFEQDGDQPASTVINFDFVGTFYDFDVAAKGQHADGKLDDYNNVNIGKYVTIGL